MMTYMLRLSAFVYEWTSFSMTKFTPSLLPTRKLIFCIVFKPIYSMKKLEILFWLPLKFHQKYYSNVLILCKDKMKISFKQISFVFYHWKQKPKSSVHSWLLVVRLNTVNYFLRKHYSIFIIYMRH